MDESFKSGSDLEYYNPIDSFELNPNDFHHRGIYDQWVKLNESGEIYPPLMVSIKWIG